MADDLRPASGRDLWLALSASSSIVTAVLCQSIDGALRVYADWLREGAADAVLDDLMKDVNLEAGRRVKVVIPPQHYDRYNNFGLRQMAAKLNLDVRQGLPPERGRIEVRSLLKQEVRGTQALLVSNRAIWTSNGFAGGYCRALQKGGMLAEFAEEGPYRVVLESLESFAGLLRSVVGEDDEQAEIRYDTTANGRRFISARR